MSNCCSRSVRSSGDSSDKEVKDSSGSAEEADEDEVDGPKEEVQRARQVRAKSEHRDDRYSVREEVCAGVLALAVA